MGIQFIIVKYFAVGSEGESDLDLLVNSRHLETCRSLILDCLVHLSPFDGFVGTVNDYLFPSRSQRIRRFCLDRDPGKKEGRKCS